jgi:integrase
VRETIPETVYSAIGIRVPPHMFRVAAASSAAIHSPTTPGLASALLHHVDLKITELHYNRAGAMSASAAYSAVIDLYRD